LAKAKGIDTEALEAQSNSNFGLDENDTYHQDNGDNKTTLQFELEGVRDLVWQKMMKIKHFAHRL